MRLPIRPLIALLAAALCATGLSVATSGSATGAAAYSVRTLHFKVTVGPNDQTCNIIGDLYLPRGASKHAPVPAIMTTNGFGGSKDGQAGIGEGFASRGYAVLSYSGLGFGGSTCKITLDDPDYDGVAGKQLVSYLGGARGIAFLDAGHTRPAPSLGAIVRDTRANDGVRRPHDPRVGLIGGSYGGQNQFAIAGQDPRVDTIVPIITWNDLSYSLGPNNTTQTEGVSTSVPGATKLTWGLGFTALGMLNGVQNAAGDPARLIPCPNFTNFVCPAVVTAGTTGYFQPSAVRALRHASVSDYISRIKVPVFLWQGQSDTLFNLNEAIATYQALKEQGTPVKMLWQSWGHTNGTPAEGEIDLANLDPEAQYQTGRVLAWFDRYLKGKSVSTGPEFAYFRHWVSYSGNAKPAYRTARQYPVGTKIEYRLSGRDLVTDATPAVGTQTFLTPAAGIPTRLEMFDAVGSVPQLKLLPPLVEDDLPGTFASWQTSPLARARNVVGTPTLKLRVEAPLAALTQATGPAGKLVLFVRLQDVDASGKATDIEQLTAPVRVDNVNQAFTVTLPAIVHQFERGHRIRLVVAGGSVNYRGGLTPNPVSITTGSAEQVLTLPVVN